MNRQAAFQSGARAAAAEVWRRAMAIAGDPPDGLRWFYVSLPFATFAVGVLDGRVVTGPNFIRKHLGREWSDLARVWRRANRPGRPPVVIIKPLP